MIHSSNSSKKNTGSDRKPKSIIRKKNLHVYDEKFRNPHLMNLIKEKMKLKNSRGFYRSNMFGEEIIRDGVKYKCLTKQGRKYLPYLYIFSLVKRDAKNYVSRTPQKPHKWLTSIHYNMKCDPVGKRIIGTDINEAYWDIAFKLGILSENTYRHANKIEHKNLLLASLSSLGADKMWRNIKGVIGNDVTIIRGDDRLKEAFKLIRFTCFKYMRQLAKLLGNDFVCYKTDCIYYIHTKENVKIVEEFIRSKGLQYKALRRPKKMEEDKI